MLIYLYKKILKEQCRGTTAQVQNYKERTTSVKRKTKGNLISGNTKSKSEEEVVLPARTQSAEEIYYEA